MRCTSLSLLLTICIVSLAFGDAPFAGIKETEDEVLSLSRTPLNTFEFRATSSDSEAFVLGWGRWSWYMELDPDDLLRMRLWHLKNRMQEILYFRGTGDDEYMVTSEGKAFKNGELYGLPVYSAEELDAEPTPEKVKYLEIHKLDQAVSDAVLRRFTSVEIVNLCCPGSEEVGRIVKGLPLKYFGLGLSLSTLFAKVREVIEGSPEGDRYGVMDAQAVLLKALPGSGITHLLLESADEKTGEAIAACLNLRALWIRRASSAVAEAPDVLLRKIPLAGLLALRLPDNVRIRAPYSEALEDSVKLKHISGCVVLKSGRPFRSALSVRMSVPYCAITLQECRYLRVATLPADFWRELAPYYQIESPCLRFFSIPVGVGFPGLSRLPEGLSGLQVMYPGSEEKETARMKRLKFLVCGEMTIIDDAEDSLSLSLRELLVTQSIQYIQSRWAWFRPAFDLMSWQRHATLAELFAKITTKDARVAVGVSTEEPCCWPEAVPGVNINFFYSSAWKRHWASDVKYLNRVIPPRWEALAEPEEVAEEPRAEDLMYLLRCLAICQPKQDAAKGK